MTERNVLLKGVVGSTAYGLAREGSDIDQLGIFLAPIREVLGLRSDKVVDQSDVQHEPSDVTLHEVGKYCQLALQCNPTVLELMYLSEYVVKTTAGALLIQNRHHFLSGPAVKGRYGGYARSQADRLMRRNAEGKDGFSSDTKARTAKHARHCMRLMWQGGELLKTGRIPIKVPPAERDILFLMGDLAVTDPEKFYRRFEVSIGKFDNIETKLPDKPNREEIDNILVAIRLAS